MRKLIFLAAILAAMAPMAVLASGPVSGPRFVTIYHQAGMICWGTGDALQIAYAGWRRGEGESWEVADLAGRTGRACNYFLWQQDLPIPKGPTQRKLFSAWHDAGEMWVGYANAAYDDATGRYHVTPTADALDGAKAIATRINYYSKLLDEGRR